MVELAIPNTATLLVLVYLAMEEITAKSSVLEATQDVSARSVLVTIINVHMV